MIFPAPHPRDESGVGSIQFVDNQEGKAFPLRRLVPRKRRERMKLILPHYNIISNCFILLEKRFDSLRASRREGEDKEGGARGRDGSG